jgi:hypothetical protein
MRQENDVAVATLPVNPHAMTLKKNTGYQGEVKFGPSATET